MTCHGNAPLERYVRTYVGRYRYGCMTINSLTFFSIGFAMEMGFLLVRLYGTVPYCRIKYDKTNCTISYNCTVWCDTEKKRNVNFFKKKRHNLYITSITCTGTVQY